MACVMNVQISCLEVSTSEKCSESRYVWTTQRVEEEKITMDDEEGQEQSNTYCKGSPRL